MDDRQKKFNEVKEKAEVEYKIIGNVFSPFLKRKINFNTKGLDHIKFKEWNKARPITDQFLRLKFLSLAPKILAHTNTIQEFNGSKSLERIKSNAKWNFLAKSVKYYGFVVLWNYKIKIKIIVKEIEGGEPFFWSIIPFWKTKRDPIIEETKKVFHEGDLERD
ncbi:MAG: hypothetical protein WCP18_01095 [bacterium]